MIQIPPDKVQVVTEPIGLRQDAQLFLIHGVDLRIGAEQFSQSQGKRAGNRLPGPPSGREPGFLGGEALDYDGSFEKII